MKVLLTGQLPPSVRYIGARLIRDGHRVSALGRVPDAQALQSAGIAVRAHADLRRLMEAARFGAVVFFAALRCDDPAEGGSPPGSLLDELSAVVRAARESGVGQLILVTDRRAFGSAQAGREDEEPASRTPAGILLRAAEENVNRCAEDGQCARSLFALTNCTPRSDPDSFFSAAAAGAGAGAELLSTHAARRATFCTSTTWRCSSSRAHRQAHVGRRAPRLRHPAHDGESPRFS